MWVRNLRGLFSWNKCTRSLTTTSTFDLKNVNKKWLYSYIKENSRDIKLYDLCSYIEDLYSSGLVDVDINQILVDRILYNLNDVKSLKLLSKLLRLLNVPSHTSDNFYKELVNYIHLNDMYPAIHHSPRIWTTYFKFIGNNRIYHKNLLNHVSYMFKNYLTNVLNHSRRDGDNVVYPRRLQESIAMCAWSYGICTPNMDSSELFDVLLKFINRGMNYSVLTRIYWSLAMKNYKLSEISLSDITYLYNHILSNNFNNNKTHLHQIYTILRCMDIKGLDVGDLLETCKNTLIGLNYGKNNSTISKGHKYISDVLVRLNVPHRLEILTSNLVSIDIVIDCDEKIAIEVDGPIHFLRNCDDLRVLRTGPSLFKEMLLKHDGWIYISLPPMLLTNINDIDSIDMHYKNLLIKSDSVYLKKLLL